MVMIMGLLIAELPAQEEVGIVVAESVGARIVVDGNVSDWAGIKPAYVDTIGDGNGSEFDFAAAYVANDENYLYIRISFADIVPFGDAGYRVNIAFNTDFDPSTGFGFAGLTGSEFFIQSGGVFDQRSGVNFVDVYEQNAENNWGAFAFANTAPYEDTKDVEISLRRDLTFSNDANGLPGLLNPDNSPLFEFPDFQILFEAEDPDFNSVEFMPNADPAGGQVGIEYTFAEGPVAVMEWGLY
jgi:hypothetical protein